MVRVTLLLVTATLVRPSLAEAQIATLLGIADSLGVPGAAWAVVRGGEVTDLGAFGSMDGARPVNPSTSVFRVASVSKAVTAALAARLAARKEVDLDADLRSGIEWLAMDEPITMRQLLTHTSGLDDRLLGMLARTPDDIEDPGEHLRRNLPPRTTPPGRYVRYSNYGVALAGYALSRAAGLPFDRLAERELFEPLGMTSSSFRQPIPDSLLARLAEAFPCADFSCAARPLDYRNTPPAGAMVTTAGDMGRFIESILAGRLGAEATRILTQRTFAPRPDLPGMALALQEQTIAGRRALVHAGASSGYMALLVLVPDAGAGLFLVAGGGSPDFGRLAVQSFERTIDSLPYPPQPDPRPATDRERAEYAGTYLLTRAPRGTMERFPALFAYGSLIGFDDEGFLVRREGDVRRRYGLVESDVFRSVDGPERLAFERKEGRVSGLYAADEFFGIRFPASYERLPAWRTPHFTNELMSWLLGLPAMALALWLLTGLVRLVRRRARPVGSRMSPVSAIAAAAATVAMGMFGFGFLAPFNRLAMDAPEELGYGLPGALASALPRAWAIPVLAVVVLLLAFRRTAWPDRVLLLVTGLSALGFSAMLMYFNLLPPTW